MMATNTIDDEKPNLRPTKRLTANGKSLFLHHYPYSPSSASVVQTIRKSTDKENLVQDQQADVLYSLNKQQRWEILDEINNQSSSSADDDDDVRHTHSDSEQIPRRKTRSVRQTIRQQYNLNRTKDTATDVKYFSAVLPADMKYLANIRKTYGSKNRKHTSSIQRARFTQNKEQVDDIEQLKDENDYLSTDEEELTTSFNHSSRLQLDAFIPLESADTKDKTRSKLEKTQLRSEIPNRPSPIYYNDDNPSSEINRFCRQISKEEKLFQRDMTNFLKKQEENGHSIQPKPPQQLMSLSFRRISFHPTEITFEHLSKTYGKNFLHANCHPSTYLICLTDRLKSFPWTNKPDLFPIYSTLNCYLVIILNHSDNLSQGQVAINMDLSLDTIEIENLSNEYVYTIEELIHKTMEYITNLSFEVFKPIDSQISERKHLKKDHDHQFNENELLNKHIYQIQSLEKKDSQAEESNSLRPEICTSCYGDMTESTPMTALKSCSHWFCNQCWKQYLENSIKSIKIIGCPEWNCTSVVDIGTLLSLINTRHMNIYKRTIDKCLVNLSRSYVKCPSKSCSNIVPVTATMVDGIRCRCGLQFCMDCKDEPHFPATCASYRVYIDEAGRSGDLTTSYNTKTTIQGRKCISCHEFIEKNGGCNHMTCTCGAEFCWVCTAYWKDHYASDGRFSCPKLPVSIQKQWFFKEHNSSRKYYECAIYHRMERTFPNQAKLNDNVKRLIGTIPLDKDKQFDSSLIQIQITKRQALLQHCYEMVKYIVYLHRVCEYVAVAADGYANDPPEFVNTLYPLQTALLNLSQVIEGGKGYQAIEQLNHLHKNSEKLVERLRQAVIRRQRHAAQGYLTS